MESFVRKSWLYCITFPWMQRESESESPRKNLICKNHVDFLSKLQKCELFYHFVDMIFWYEVPLPSLRIHFQFQAETGERCKTTQEVVASGKNLISRNPIKSWKCSEKRLVWLWDLINLHLDLRVNWFSPSRSYGPLSAQASASSARVKGVILWGG